MITCFGLAFGPAAKRAHQRAAKAKAATATPPAGTPSAPTPTPPPVSTPAAGLAAGPPPPPATAPAMGAPSICPPLLNDAASVSRREQWASLEEPCPLYTIVTDDDLPPVAEVRAAYDARLASQGLSPSSSDFTSALDAIEVRWGGLSGNYDACINYRARYALSAGFPLTPSLVVDLYAGSHTGAQRDRILRDADIHLGGSGDGSSLTPIAYFRKNAPWNLLFLEHLVPNRADIPRLLHLCDAEVDSREFPLLVEQWDYALDGTGDGAALRAAFPPDAWRNAPDTLDRIAAVSSPDPTLAEPTARLTAAIARLSGPRLQPTPLSISRLLQRYVDWSDTPASEFSQTTIELMAVEHTPFRPRIDGFPWHHELSPFVLRRLQAPDVTVPTRF